MKGDRLKRGPRQVRGSRASGEANDRPACILVPVGRTEPGERGNKIDPAIILHGSRQGLNIAGSAGQDCRDDVPMVVSQQPETTSAVAPVAVKTTEAAPRGEREASASGERTRTMSYIILRGLQGAGPFLGSR